MMTHWKTTANGILAFLITTLTVVLGFQIPTAILNPSASRVYLYSTVAANLVLALCRAWIGMIQHDAPAPDSVVVQTTLSSKVVPLILVVLMLGVAAQAQTAPAVTAPAFPTSVYGVGVSYDNGATPSMAGTLTFSHLLTSTDTACTNLVSVCYGYTVLDILPVTFSPTVVSTNVGVGVAQKALTIGKVNFFVPVGIGPTITGTNVGWNWSGGGLADVPITKAGQSTNWHFQPNIRFVNANVNGVNNGYRLIFGFNFAFAQ